MLTTAPTSLFRDLLTNILSIMNPSRHASSMNEGAGQERALTLMKHTKKWYATIKGSACMI